MTHPLAPIRAWIVAGIVLGASVVASRAVAAEPAKAAPRPAGVDAASDQRNEADEKAIRASADAFVKAFNAADAKAVGALWAADAEYTGRSGAGP